MEYSVKYPFTFHVNLKQRWLHLQQYQHNVQLPLIHRGRRGRDRMAVGFTSTYAISAFHH